MWLSRQIAARDNGKNTTVSGRVTSGQGALTVQADGEYKNIEVYGPSGVASLPVIGSDAMLTEVNGQKIMLGIRNDMSGLQPGEIRLRSAGGAEIWLKNTGEIVINGQIISAAEEEEA